MMEGYARITLKNRQVEQVPVSICEKSWGFTASLSRQAVPQGTERVDFLPDYMTARAGEEGYFVIPGAPVEGTLLTRFHEREDQEYDALFSHMAFLGMRRGAEGILAIVTGMPLYFAAVTGVKDGVYYAYPRFHLDGEEAPSDLVVEYHVLPGADYSAMARCYREYKLTRCGCEPLAQRAQRDPRLKKAAEGPEIRIRQGWKPVPSEIEHQTPQNEPPMHVACSFARACDIIDEMSRQGLQGGEICLVGWNIGGHDGRFPQIFPPDPRLGGQEGLDKLIAKAHEAGMNIVCHTSSTAAYQIADCWDEEYLLRNADGSLHKRPYCWGGGRPYKVCPRRQYERFDSDDLPKLAKMGFEGIHYIDVMTIIPVLACFDPRHPLTREQSADWYRKTMALSRQEIGGFASEGGYDYAAELLDYALYTSFHVLDKKWHGMFDENIPFWQLVYHGIILYNACTDTLNYPAKSEAHRLKYLEYGGRPLGVYYANFAKGNNWMGKEDLLCDDEAQLQRSVGCLKVMYLDYEALSQVRYAFMDSHAQVGPGRYLVTYSNGIQVEVDYEQEQAFLIQDGQRRQL